MKNHKYLLYPLLTLFFLKISAFAQPTDPLNLPDHFQSPYYLNSLNLRVYHNKVRLSFKANQSLPYHESLLLNPHRLVVDFKHSTLLPNFIKPKLHTQLVKRIRYGSTPERLRIVFDLNEEAQIHYVTPSTKQGRTQHLIIDLSTHQPPKDQKKTRKKPIVIVIDPGHGGKDPGAIGIRGILEKNIVLSIAKTLQQILQQQTHFKVLLTRKKDRYLTLRERLKLARLVQADMFIAIHADAYLNHRAHGTSVYALSQKGATSEAARWLAEKENHSELMGGVNLSHHSKLVNSVLINLQQTATIVASLKLGEHILKTLKKIAETHHNWVEQAAFVVLKSPDIPSLLVETGFLSNPEEALKLSKQPYRYHLALAIAQGIQSYIKSHLSSVQGA